MTQQQEESVVTPDRFATGLTWEQYQERIQNNKEKFQLNYRDADLPEDDVAAIRELMARPNGPAKALALGEDWCPDVFRGLPVMARLAESTGLELRIFPRDENTDIMSEFLKGGEHQSIPTLVFYSRNHDYLGHWIERPAQANEQMAEVSKLFEGRSREEARPLYEEFQKGPIWAGWRVETVREIRRLLEKNCQA